MIEQIDKDKKIWFKYEFGFVNLDDELLYLTNTGNWSEASKLKEKSKNGSHKKRFKRTRVSMFLIVSLLVFLALFLYNISGSSISLLLLLGLPIAGYKLYQYLKSEMGTTCKIPLLKLVAISMEKNDVVIKFLNGDEEEDLLTLKNFDSRGLQIFERLKRTF